MTKLMLIITLLIVSNSVFADGNLTHLKVDADIVYFATDEAKAATSPSCMASENSDKWSVSLNSATGKAIYALLVTAVADKRKVAITSANDCADAVGIERAKSVALGQANTIENASSSEFVPTHYSGIKYLASGASGTIITITPPEGERVRLNSIYATNTSLERNISVHIGNKTAIDNLSLRAHGTSVGSFFVSHNSSLSYLQGEIGETIQVIKETGTTSYPIYYSYSFSK